MPLDITAIRAQFPALGAGAAHFDGPGGSQTPSSVAGAMRDTMLMPIANRGAVTVAEGNAERVVGAARAAVADLLGASPAGVVFGRSMTQLTFDFARTMSAQWSPGDEVVVSRLDHDANVRPWVIAADRAGAHVRWIDIDRETTEVSLDQVRSLLSERTRLVAITGASNLVGTRPDIAGVAAAVHDVGALLYVDGVHLAAHALVDVEALGADFFVCSPYKFFGPHCGILAAAPELLERLHPDKLLPSTDAVPERFELGTLPYELLAGTTAAVDFLAGIGGTAGTRRERLASSFGALEEHEDTLRERVEQHLAALDGVTLHSRARDRTPTLLLTFTGKSPSDAYRFLAERGVNAPAGTFYAYETARALGLWPDGGLRIGLAAYTSADDVDRLLGGLDAFTGA